MKSSIIDMKPKDTIKLDIVEQDRCETCPEENVLLEDGLYIISLSAWWTIWRSKKEELLALFWVKIHRLDKIVNELVNCVLYYQQDGPDRSFLLEELRHIPGDTPVPPKWVSK